MFQICRAAAFATILGLAACGAPRQTPYVPYSAVGAPDAARYAWADRPETYRPGPSVDWRRAAREAMTGRAPRGGIANNRDYSRNWTQTSSRGRCTFFGTGGSICSR